MKKLLSLFSGLGIVLVAAFALLATPAFAANPLQCFSGTTDIPAYGGICTLVSGGATLNNTVAINGAAYSGVSTTVSSLTSKTLAQVDQLSFNYTGTPTAGSPRISLPVDTLGNGTNKVYASIGANLCTSGDHLVDAINNPSCKIFITGGDVGGYTGWAAFVAAFPSAKVGPGVPFVVADDAGLWTVSNIHLGTATEQVAYTQADFKAFDGVATGTNSYTVSSGITAAYTGGTGTLSDPVKLTLTGYAPIVTPWFMPTWTTYNYVTVGIKLPAGFTGTSVYQTGIMRYDDPTNYPNGYYSMGTGSTALATAGAALGYLDYSFAANSTNTKKDGLVKLEVIWNANSAPEYFTIDVSGLWYTNITAPDGCAAGNKFSTTTGRNCNAATPAVPANKSIQTDAGCLAGNIFSTSTGRNCNAATPAVPAGKVLSAAPSISHSIIKNGSNGNDVMEIQNLLNTAGNDSGIADGKFGPKTKEAVIKFQNAHGLKGDGVVGAATRAALNK